MPSELDVAKSLLRTRSGYTSVLMQSNNVAWWVRVMVYEQGVSAMFIGHVGMVMARLRLNYL